MDIETKLDEDFLFYMGFTDVYFQRLSSDNDIEKGDVSLTAASVFLCCNCCPQAWLQKLCKMPFKGVDAKRERNIYMANLVCCMESGELSGPFLEEVPAKLKKAAAVFGKPSKDMKEPAWLSDIMDGGGDDFSHQSRDGRTYLATKALPDGQGAFGYVAVSLDEDQPQWFHQKGLDTLMEKKFQEYNPPLTEIEKILIMRTNPAERQRICEFYDAIIKSVKSEIEGSVPFGRNEAVNELLSQLAEDLTKRGKFGEYESLPDDARRLELLYILDDRLRARRDRIQRNEVLLDDIEERVKPDEFWDTSLQPEDVYKEHKNAYAIQMWNEAIGNGPKKKFMDMMEVKYPEELVETFLSFLANMKEKIAVRCQRRHENIVSQLKKELRKEGERGKRKLEEVKAKGEEIIRVVDLVRQAEQTAYESHRMRDEMLMGNRKERNDMYEQMRNALLETQQSVEEEAERGRLLTKQINDVNEQTEAYHEVNEKSIRKIEDANIQLMKNISRMNKAVRQHEARLKQIKELAAAEAAQESDQQYFFM